MFIFYVISRFEAQIKLLSNGKLFLIFLSLSFPIRRVKKQIEERGEEKLISVSEVLFENWNNEILTDIYEAEGKIIFSAGASRNYINDIAMATVLYSSL